MQLKNQYFSKKNSSPRVESVRERPRLEIQICFLVEKRVSNSRKLKTNRASCLISTSITQNDRRDPCSGRNFEKIAFFEFGLFKTVKKPKTGKI